MGAKKKTSNRLSLPILNLPNGVPSFHVNQNVRNRNKLVLEQPVVRPVNFLSKNLRDRTTRKQYSGLPSANTQIIRTFDLKNSATSRNESVKNAGLDVFPQNLREVVRNLENSNKSARSVPTNVKGPSRQNSQKRPRNSTKSRGNANRTKSRGSVPNSMPSRANNVLSNYVAGLLRSNLNVKGPYLQNSQKRPRNSTNSRGNNKRAKTASPSNANLALVDDQASVVLKYAFAPTTVQTNNELIKMIKNGENTVLRHLLHLVTDTDRQLAGEIYCFLRKRNVPISKIAEVTRQIFDLLGVNVRNKMQDVWMVKLQPLPRRRVIRGWTDPEVRLLAVGMAAFGTNYDRIQKYVLPHMTTAKIREKINRIEFHKDKDIFETLIIKGKGDVGIAFPYIYVPPFVRRIEQVVNVLRGDTEISSLSKEYRRQLAGHLRGRKHEFPPK